ncbi:MAG: DUF45 domain-containing protein [Bacteroidaceae bacterium]|nr:DUF45 domain-containing protein [Bacteroidaceae bacterium]
MATKRIIPDADFGQIIIRSRRTACNITMRAKQDGLHVTVPPYSFLNKIMEAIEKFRKPLLESWVKNTPEAFSLDYRINAPCFRLRLEQSGLKCFTLKQAEEGIILYCPKQTDFASEATQKLIKNAIIRGLKKAASAYLPPLLEALSKRYNLPFKRVKITGSKSRWGSCSAVKSINLSCYLMLLPPHLMDYVLLHELAHTREMNHGPKFWELMNELTEGQAKSLRAELKKFRTIF